MNITRKLATIAAAAALAFPLGACNAAAPADTAASQAVEGSAPLSPTEEGAVDPVEGTSVTPAGNPVDILRKIDGCTIPEGVTSGRPWEGTRQAECQFLDGDIVDASVTVTTIPAEFDARLEYPDHMPAVDSDMEATIVGRGFMLKVLDTTMRTVDINAVASAVGGEIVTADSFRAFMLADGNGTGN